MNVKDAVSLDHMTRTYKRDNFEIRALDDVTLAIPEHSFVAIMGPPGSGKTTMLNLITGIDHPTSGRISVGQEELNGILGQIVEEPIEEGQRVKTGDLLARIDDRDYQAQLQQTIADRDLARANVQLWSSKAERQQQFFASAVISKDDYDTSENALSLAQAMLKRDEAAIDYAKFQVNQCLIVAPISGIVLQKYREIGDTINYGGQVQAGGGATDIAQLADTSDMRAEVDIND